MSIDELPDLNPPQYGDIEDHDRPILSFAWRAEGAHRLAAHSHPRAHIIVPESGAYWVITAKGTWLVPVGQAIWIAPGVHHQVYSHGPVSARMLFVDRAYAAPLPERSGTVAVSPLLRQLLLRAVEYGNEYVVEGPMSRLAKVILDELSSLELAPLVLPISDEPRLARVMEKLIEAPGVAAGLDAVAQEGGVSARTLARLFRKETGLSFAEWKTRLRLLESVERLAHGASVTEVAFELGYGSTSSFVYMFRSHMGVPPGRFRAADSG